MFKHTYTYVNADGQTCIASMRRIPLNRDVNRSHSFTRRTNDIFRSIKYYS